MSQLGYIPLLTVCRVNLEPISESDSDLAVPPPRCVLPFPNTAPAPRWSTAAQAATMRPRCVCVQLRQILIRKEENFWAHCSAHTAGPAVLMWAISIPPTWAMYMYVPGTRQLLEA